MAKTTKGATRGGKKPSTPPVRAAEEIRKFYELGIRVLERAKAESKPNDTAARLVSVEDGVSFDRARKAWRIARSVDEGTLNQVCELCCTWKVALSMNHLRFVLGLVKPTDRLTWLQRAAREGWSADRLKLQMTREKARKGGLGGRAIKVPGDVLDGLEQVILQSDEWLKRYDRIWREDATWPPLVPGSPNLEISIARLEKARSDLERLRKAVTSLEKQLSHLDCELERTGSTVVAKRSRKRK